MRAREGGEAVDCEKTIRRAILVAMACLAGGAVLSLPGPGAAFRNLKEGATPAAFALKDLGGQEVRFDPAAGKATVLCFLEVSQGRSVDALKDLVRMQSRPEAKDVAFVGIIPGNDNLAEAKRLVAEFKVGFPVLVDEGQKLYGEYGLYILPSTAIVGKDGKLVFEQAGHMRDYDAAVGGRLKVLAGLMKEDDYRKSMTPIESAPRSREEGEADKEVALGNTLLKRGMVDKAGEKFAMAVRFDPKHVKARIALGETLLASKQLDNALLQFEEAGRLAPGNKDAQLGVGMVHLARGAVDNAIRLITEATMLNPRPEKATFRLGTAYEKKGDYANAVKCYRKVCEKLLKD
jgi:tetratricopeptide (TPR) repeat protein